MLVPVKLVDQPNSAFVLDTNDCDNSAWSEVIDRFSDATIYQTWAYEAERQPPNRLVRAVLRESGMPVAAAQVRILVEVPHLFGMGYIFWGPLWDRDGHDKNPTVFREMLRALRTEFVNKRKHLLRILPRIIDDANSIQIREILEQEGFVQNHSVPRKRTLIIDMTRSSEELRAGLERSWRKHLQKAERSDLTLIEGFGDELFASFLPLYRQLIDRKRYPVPNDVGQFMRMQPLLPDRHKLRIILAQREGKICAGAIGAALGKTGITLFRAASRAGMEVNAPYLVHWRLLEWIKSQGCTTYDLSGINPEHNPGTYTYKRGLCGRNGVDSHYIGAFECFPSVLHRFIGKVGEHTAKRVRDALLISRWKSAVRSLPE